MAKMKTETKTQFAHSPLTDAEALGKIKTMPEAPIEEEFGEEKEVGAVIDSPRDFELAVGRAQMGGEDFVEVSERLFRYLLKNNKSRYLTYGKPGVKVYLAGTREEIQKEERMSADAYSAYIGRKNYEEKKARGEIDE